MWININRNGRLGNRLYSRAHVFAAAIELNETVVDWGLSDVAKHFPAIENPALPTYPKQIEAKEVRGCLARLLFSEKLIEKLRVLRPRKTGVTGPIWSQYWQKGTDNSEKMRLDTKEFADFCRRRDVVILNGFKLKCPSWVVKHQDAIREYFRPPESICRKWKTIISEQRNKFDIVVGIHMRSTDFKYAQGGRYYLSPQEYVKVIQERIDWGDTKPFFLIFSDESYNSNEEFKELSQAFEEIPHMFYHGSEIDDLTGLMHCDRIVCAATSTYARWAAFAGKADWIGVTRQVLTDTNNLEFQPHPYPWDY
ncbi:hypothetical protein HED22_07330 [Thalassospira sp. HF15]|uniref:alpha-1,2-fucosyltransferase n=1 Tax=Thalassospira sp. HF15 TaxID=2722755 RepID=UPI0014314877|nr:alpha-1,2-fucosyltransferase [Thalassospira sp. HF15]NIY75450.1 hypothetical protein [Thalassospira sp. HF15]